MQKQKINITAVLAAVFMFVAFALPSAAVAQGYRENTGRPAEVTEKIEARKAAALERIKEKRASRGQKSLEKRKAACEKRVDKLDRLTDGLYTKASRHQAVIDRFFERVQGFYDSGQLTVENYDELEADVLAAQEAATSEVKALNELNVEVDCENPDVAATVGAFRDSADAAREALKDYRKSLVALISSMRAAAAEANAGSEDDESAGDDTGSETETETESESGSQTENETETGGTN